MGKPKLTLIALLFVFALPSSAAAQGRPARPMPANQLSFLPPSDSIALIDAKRLLNEALPRVVAGDVAKLARVNADIERFKTRIGVDPRALNRIAISMRYTYPSPGITKIETVAIARGVFDSRTLTATMRAAAGGKYREEKFRGMTISILSVDDKLRLAGLWDIKIKDFAVCILDANTLALGSAANVRAAITAGRAGSRANAVLGALAGRDPKALMSFGSNITRALLDNLGVGTDAVAKDVGSIRQLYGSVGSTATDFTMLLVARTGTAAEATGVSETVTGLKQLAAILMVRLPAPTKKLAQSGLDSLKITTQGNEVQIRGQIVAADLAALIK